MAAKASYQDAYSQYHIEKNKAIAPNLKGKKIKGKGSKLKEELVRQINRYNAEAAKYREKTSQIKLKANLPTVKSSINMGKIKVKFDGSSIRLTSPDENSNQYRGELYAAVKLYKDYVKRGLIREVNGYDMLQSEEKAEYAFSVMDEKDFYKYINEANKKAEELEAKYLKDMEDPTGEKRFRAKYGF